MLLVKDMPMFVLSSNPSKGKQVVEFWRTIAGSLIPREQGARIDLFVDPLAHSIENAEFITAIEHVTNHNVILGSLDYALLCVDGNPKDDRKAAPLSRIRAMYFNQTRLILWACFSNRAANWVDKVKRTLGPLLNQSKVLVADTIAGHLLSQVFYGRWSKDVHRIAIAVSHGLQHIHEARRQKTPGQPHEEVDTERPLVAFVQFLTVWVQQEVDTDTETSGWPTLDEDARSSMSYQDTTTTPTTVRLWPCM